MSLASLLSVAGHPDLNHVVRVDAPDMSEFFQELRQIEREIINGMAIPAHLLQNTFRSIGEAETAVTECFAHEVFRIMADRHGEPEAYYGDGSRFDEI